MSPTEGGYFQASTSLQSTVLCVCLIASQVFNTPCILVAVGNHEGPEFQGLGSEGGFKSVHDDGKRSQQSIEREAPELTARSPVGRNSDAEKHILGSSIVDQR